MYIVCIYICISSISFGMRGYVGEDPKMAIWGNTEPIAISSIDGRLLVNSDWVG